jgi:hypothetical protein
MRCGAGFAYKPSPNGLIREIPSQSTITNQQSTINNRHSNRIKKATHP